MMVERLTATFLMHGARDAMANGFAHIEEQVKGIEQAVAENPALAFDLAKTVVESACRAVLAERSIAFNENDDLPKLFKTATNNLPFLPPQAAGAIEIRQSLVQCSTACTLRSKEFASCAIDVGSPLAGPKSRGQ